MSGNPHKQITERGYWICNKADQYKFDEGLADSLATFFKGEGGSVLDLGCGNGAYVDFFQRAGIHTRGCDGNPHTPEIAGEWCSVCDLSKPVGGMVCDWVVCLEVGEHIPAEYEAQLLENLDGMNRRGIVLSWAVPGQGGHGHVNEQTNQAIIAKIEAMGYEFDADSSQVFRAEADLPWFKNTVMLFRRKARENVPFRASVMRPEFAIPGV